MESTRRNSLKTSLSWTTLLTSPKILVTLMGLHMSSSDLHEKACSELTAYVGEGNVITLEKVQQVGLKYARSLHPVARTFSRSTAKTLTRSATTAAPAAVKLVAARLTFLAPSAVTSAPDITALFRPRKSPLESRSGRIRVSTLNIQSM
jgi:hypothetical protein